MNTQTAINQLGQMHIRTCHKSMWSNGQNFIGGYFKVKRTHTHQPNDIPNILKVGEAMKPKRLSPLSSSALQYQPQTAEGERVCIADAPNVSVLPSSKPQDNQLAHEPNSCGAGGYPSRNLLHKVCEDLGVFYYF